MFFRRTSLFVIVFDSVATIHFVVGIIIMLLGEYTKIFCRLCLYHGGIEFIFKYLDYPIYSLIEKYLPNSQMQYYPYMKGIFVLAISSAIYGIIAYFIVSFTKSLFEKD